MKPMTGSRPPPLPCQGMRSWSVSPAHRHLRSRTPGPWFLPFAAAEERGASGAVTFSGLIWLKFPFASSVGEGSGLVVAVGSRAVAVVDAVGGGRGSPKPLGAVILNMERDIGETFARGSGWEWITFTGRLFHILCIMSIPSPRGKPKPPQSTPVGCMAPESGFFNGYSHRNIERSLLPYNFSIPRVECRRL